MADDPNPAPNTSATPDWKQSFGAEAAPVLETFKEPGEFLKSYQTLSGELETLKKTPPTFDWRKEIAGEDESAGKLLERYTNPKDFGKAHRELVTQLRTWQGAKPLAKDAKPEEVAAWRTANGIPEKPEGYLEKLPEGLVIGEDDKPIFESFVKGLHELNADPKLAHYAVKWYSDFKEEQAAAQAENDTTHRAEVEDVLRTEWGGDYRANVNHVKAFLESLPNGVGEKLTNARDGEGRAILNDPDVLRALVATARELNPAHTIVPGTGGNQAQTIDDEISKIEKVMRTNRAEYNRDTKMQQRLRDLYGAREKLKGRAA